MTKSDFAIKVIKIVNNTNRKIKELDTVKISGDEMINADFEKAIMAMGFTEINSLINKMKRKNEKEK